MNRTESTDSLFRDRVHFGTSAILETCYALAQVSRAANEVEVHQNWCRAARKLLGPRFFDAFGELGGWPMTWSIFADTIHAASIPESFDKATDGVRQISDHKFAVEFLIGILHNEDFATALLAGDIGLKEAVTKSPRSKREWLTFSGLYPFDSKSAAAKTIEQVIRSPGIFRDQCVSLLNEFWLAVFSDTWQVLVPQFQRLSAERSRLLAATSLQQFANELRLRVEIDTGKAVIRAVRGGYTLPVSKMTSAWMLPSAFNVHHFWHVIEDGETTHAYFPHFEPGIVVGVGGETTNQVDTTQRMDPALVFKALGDPTRFAMVVLISRVPRTATDLANELGLSKGTVSHHVHVLREAGLLSESVAGKSVILALQRQTIAYLSDAMLSYLDTSLSHDSDHRSVPADADFLK